ncbi:DUF1641 domain-containing protein [Paludisphaera borealis]|uniref:DUF1641 domain-containing protein n=1 Tax=Paludisphaera borealis TaxID=1387353 RepID=A0A1U7CWH6_9BACT|nr:DUF1641 domain-containing protein [Paludisphaera borealis]APW63294.1 hypothetical protein BSF38_04858 [Paludisphaera borealis]
MAQPILLNSPPRDPRAELQSRLQNAPAEHAEALLSALELLQGLHDRGALDLMRGAVGSRDKVLEILVEAANSPESIRGVRSLIVMINMLGAIEPEALATCTRAVPTALKLMTQQPERPSLWRLIRDFTWDKDVRRGHFALITLLRSLGKSLAAGQGKD